MANQEKKRTKFVLISTICQEFSSEFLHYIAFNQTEYVTPYVTEWHKEWSNQRTRRNETPLFFQISGSTEYSFRKPFMIM